MAKKISMNEALLKIDGYLVEKGFGVESVRVHQNGEDVLVMPEAEEWELQEEIEKMSDALVELDIVFNV